MRGFRRRASVLFFFIFLTGISLASIPSAAEPPAAEKAGKWTPDDVIFTEGASQFRISPDARWVVWVKSTADKKKNRRVSNLFLSSLTEKKEIQLTRGSARHSNPRWSPDGQLIAFLSTRARPEAKPKTSRSQLWLMNPFGGEPWPVTEFERGIRTYAWIDNDTILFAAQEDPTLFERTIKEKKDTSRVVEDAVHEPPVRLFRLRVKGKKVTRLSDNDDWIRGLWLSPDGTKVVTVHQRSLSYQFDQKVKPVTFLYDLESGARTQLFTDGKILAANVRWTPDSQGFYVVTRYSTHPVYRTASIALLYFYDLAQDNVTQVDLGWENGLGFAGYDVTPDGFIALLAAGVRFKPARYTRVGETPADKRPSTALGTSGAGWQRAWMEGEHSDNIFGWTLSKDGTTLVYQYSTASKPGQWYRARLQGARIVEPRRFTELNARLKDKPIAKTEIIRWKGSLDEEVEGVLYYPHNYEPGKKYPLVLDIHGGPAGADLDAWSNNWGSPLNLWAARGAFVLRVNYHGSGNYGLAWVGSIGGGKYYDLEVPDIEAGVDYLIARGLVDPDKLGTTGWSNGAILSIALTTNSTRYRACAAGAGDVEWISDWGNVDFGAAFDNYYFGKSPLEDPELYIRKSPYFQLHTVRTPTIIFFGTEDRNVPPSQGWSHYRALQQLGQTDVRFVLFPGEPHGLRKLTHQKRKVEEELAWFDKYLFRNAEPKNEAFKENSPLGIELKRLAIKKVGVRYGVAVKKTLMPEVVKYKGLALGRFEVTRAQYAAFDKNYRFDPGTDNYPANNVSFEQAQAYCAWLSKLTGQTYRLARLEEVESLYQVRAGENTLDYWAGYKLNPDDAERLLAEVKELPGTVPLLKEVGSFKGVGKDDLVFDLGGNVAEWVIEKEGSGKAIGGSADRSADAKAVAKPANPLYIGFRVVRGAPAPEAHQPGAEKPTEPKS
ncbi:MAG: prolyl oligopeptidase family serine peptidase [Terriglobia bacterium]